MGEQHGSNWHRLRLGRVNERLIARPLGRRASQPELPAARGADWRSKYANYLRITDLLVLIWVVLGVQIAWFGFSSANVSIAGEHQITISYTAVSLLLIVAWMIALDAVGSRGYRVVGTGTQEYRLVADAATRLFGVVALVAFLFRVDFARGYVLIAFPLGLVVLALSRWMWRQWLNVQRQTGRFSSRVILIGSTESAAHISEELDRQPEAGYLVVGICIPGDLEQAKSPTTRVHRFGRLEDLQAMMKILAADTVIVTSTDELSPQRVRELSWSLEPGRQHLVMAPSLTDIGGPRIHTRPVSGLPLIHVETPKYDGRKLFAKRAFDIASSLLLILALLPVFLPIAVAIRFGSRGPILFHQERVGMKGLPFNMIKFRSMVPNAEERLVDLESKSRTEGNSVMFKMRDDPRITSLGRFLRRFSLDELPQLFNVLAGSMSLVGPRPPLEREVRKYESHVHRRFLVKPGITGLWQVSGRSNLSWEDTVRLDLYYVENWSITGDLVILWRTGRAVIAREGAF